MIKKGIKENTCHSSIINNVEAKTDKQERNREEHAR